MRESELPMSALYNSGFDRLKRFDNSKTKLKIKPVMVVYEDDYSKKKKNVHVVSMEV